MNSKLIATTFFFAFIFLSGFWLSRTGKPYSTVIFNIHKLIGLAAGIFLIVTVFRLHKAMSIEPVHIGMLVITILIFVFLVAAGGLLSAAAGGGLQNAGPALLNAAGLIHKVFPYLAVLATGSTLCLLLL